MKKKKHIITIEKPCQEDWDEMTISGNERFCGACQNSVFDFSALSDTELVHALKSNTSHCGNFNVEQLNRIISMDYPGRTPTFSLHAIALGLGILIAVPGYASERSLDQSSVNLIELIKHQENVPQIDSSNPTDSLFIFKLVLTRSKAPMSNVRIEFLDQRGNVADKGKTNDQGILVYEKKMLHELQIQEIRFIPDSKSFKRKVITWVPTREEEMTVNFDVQYKQPHNMRKGRYTRF